MPALPTKGLLVPIEWTITPIKQTMTSGGYTMSGTSGLRPWTETATFTWTMPKPDALALIAELKSGFFNRVYDYTCNVRGPIKVRPTDAAGFQETYGSLNVTVTLNLEVVSG
jgi:hypothetical protein